MGGGEGGWIKGIPPGKGKKRTNYAFWGEGKDEPAKSGPLRGRKRERAALAYPFRKKKRKLYQDLPGAEYELRGSERGNDVRMGHRKKKKGGVGGGAGA